MWGTSLQALFLAHISQAFAFSVGILLVGGLTRRTSIWVISNILGMLGKLALSLGGMRLGLDMNIAAVVLTLLALSLKAGAFSQGRWLARRNRWGVLCLLGVAIAGGLYLADSDGEYRALQLSVAAFLVVSSMAAFAAANRQFYGLRSFNLLLGIYVVAVPILLYRIAMAHPFGPYTNYLGTGDGPRQMLLSMVVLSISLQITFLMLLVERQARDRLFVVRRGARSTERALVLRQGRDELKQLADERLELLRLLTHEVRQPLNNAQAILQSVMNELPLWNAAAGGGGLAATAGRIQSVLDDVILTLSNAIVAASILQWQNNPNFVQIGATEVLGFAILDCPRDEVGRIGISQPDVETYLFADPSLLRLALRNLLSNALRYSPPGSALQCEVILDDERAGVAYRITNELSDPEYLNSEIFERGQRGRGAIEHGFGLGLHMVLQTAQIHHGDLVCWQSDTDHVTFELFIPS